MAIMVRKPAFITVVRVDEVEVARIAREAMLRLLDDVPCLPLNCNRVLAELYMGSALRSGRAIESAPVRLGEFAQPGKLWLRRLGTVGRRGQSNDTG